MTFCVTWVVERIVTTHFLNPLDGMASSRNRLIEPGGKGPSPTFSAFLRVSVDSNQNRQVIFQMISIFPRVKKEYHKPELRILPNFHHYYLLKSGFEDLVQSSCFCYSPLALVLLTPMYLIWSMTKDSLAVCKIAGRFDGHFVIVKPKEQPLDLERNVDAELNTA